MSIGIEGYMKKIDEDQYQVIYEYKVADIDIHYISGHSVFENIEPGYVTIDKDCFIGPEIHERIRKRPSGRKYLSVKKIPIPVKYGDYIRQGKITIEPCTYWSYFGRTSENQLYKMLYGLFKKYQVEEKIPVNIFMRY